MSKLNKKRWIYLAFVLLLSLFLITVTGCSGSGSSGGDKATGDKTEGAASGDTINIGVLVPYTGELGAYGNYWYNGAKAAVDEMNANGGVLGKQIKIYTEDSESSVEQGIRAAQKLVKANKVIAIHGTESSVAVAIYPFAKESKVTIANPAGGSTRLDQMGPDYMFRTCPSDNFEGIVVAKMLKDAGFKSVAIMYENDESRASSAAALTKEFEKLGGKVTSVVYAARQTSYLNELKKAFADKPDAFFLAGGQESGATIIKEWYQRGYGGQLIVTADLTVPEFFTFVSPEAVEGAWGEMPMTDTNLPEYKQFAEIYKKYIGEAPTGSYESNSYDAMIILGLAMEIAGEASGTAISEHYKDTSDPNGVVVTSFKQAVEEIKKGNKINYQGASGPCDFDKYGNVVGSYVKIIAKNGKWEQGDFYPASTFDDYIKSQQ